MYALMKKKEVRIAEPKEKGIVKETVNKLHPKINIVDLIGKVNIDENTVLRINVNIPTPGLISMSLFKTAFCDHTPTGYGVHTSNIDSLVQYPVYYSELISSSKYTASTIVPEPDYGLCAYYFYRRAIDYILSNSPLDSHIFVVFVNMSRYIYCHDLISTLSRGLVKVGHIGKLKLTVTMRSEGVGCYEELKQYTLPSGDLSPNVNVKGSSVCRYVISHRSLSPDGMFKSDPFIYVNKVMSVLDPDIRTLYTMFVPLSWQEIESRAGNLMSQEGSDLYLGIGCGPRTNLFMLRGRYDTVSGECKLDKGKMNWYDMNVRHIRCTDRTCRDCYIFVRFCRNPVSSDLLCSILKLDGWGK